MIKVPLWIRELLKCDGSRALTADWDIGNGRMIQADKIRARDGDGLALYEDGGTGIFVKDGGNVGIGTVNPAFILDLFGDLLRVGKGGTGANNATIYLNAGSNNATAGVHGLRNGVSVWGFSNAVNAVSDFLMDYKGAYYFRDIDDSYKTTLMIDTLGKIGIATAAPANSLAVNRQADDGIVIDIEQADVVEGNIAVSGNTVSYNAFMGSHYTQLKVGQNVPPVGAIVVSTGEIIPCEAHIEVPVMARYYEDEDEIPIEEGIEDDIIKAQVDTGRKQIAYVLLKGKVIKTEIPVLETVQRLRGKKLKENCRLDEENGKIYKKINRVLTANEAPPENVIILERQKTKGGVLLTEIKTKAVSGIERKEYFSYIELASQKADKRVYGVYHAKMCDDSKGQSFGEDNKPVHQIAAVGLYKVRVTDTNGDIAAGDYIQSSIREGEGERQDDDVVHNYTVAKSIIDVDWNEVGVDPQLGYKWKLISATLHAG